MLSRSGGSGENLVHYNMWRDDREAEGARLLSGCTGKTRTEGSNPSLSATSPSAFGRIRRWTSGLRSASSLLHLRCSPLVRFRESTARWLAVDRVLWLGARCAPYVAPHLVSAPKSKGLAKG